MEDLDRRLKSLAFLAFAGYGLAIGAVWWCGKQDEKLEYHRLELGFLGDQVRTLRGRLDHMASNSAAAREVPRAKPPVKPRAPRSASKAKLTVV